MKVVHIIINTKVGGGQIMLERYLSALEPQEAKDHSVISLMENGSVGEKIRASGVEILSLDLKSAWGTPLAIAKLRSVLRKKQPDVVFGWMYHACLAAWVGLAGWYTRRPALIWGIHHSLQDVKNEKYSTRAILNAMSAVSKQIDLITYCSKVSRHQHESFGFSSGHGMHIPNAINVEQFHPKPEAHARLAVLCGVPETRFLIGNISRSHPMKDHVSMIKAVAQVLEAGHDVQAVVIGEGHKNGPAVKTAQELGISDRLTVLDLRDDVSELVPGLDVFLLSSAWGEAFSLAAAEAMASGVSCVVTNVGDCSYLVGDAGLVVPPSNPEAMAHAVCELLDADATYRQTLGAKARQRVNKKFSTSSYVELHREAYCKVTETSGRPGQKQLG